jgi:hypothetical protein
MWWSEGMKILRHGKKGANTLKGACDYCKCTVMVNIKVTKELIDRDTEPGMATRYVHCPECPNEYLWLK